MCKIDINLTTTNNKIWILCIFVWTYYAHACTEFTRKHVKTVWMTESFESQDESTDTTYSYWKRPSKPNRWHFHLNISGKFERDMTFPFCKVSQKCSKQVDVSIFLWEAIQLIEASTKWLTVCKRLRKCIFVKRKCYNLIRICSSRSNQLMGQSMPSNYLNQWWPSSLTQIWATRPWSFIPKP